VPAVRQACGLDHGRRLDAGDLDRRVVRQARDFHVAERLDERAASKRTGSAAVILAAVVTAR
jgi:hypothetical protein